MRLGLRFKFQASKLPPFSFDFPEETPKLKGWGVSEFRKLGNFSWETWKPGPPPPSFSFKFPAKKTRNARRHQVPGPRRPRTGPVAHVAIRVEHPCAHAHSRNVSRDRRSRKRGGRERAMVGVNLKSRGVASGSAVPKNECF